MILLLICCVCSFVAGIFITRSIYKRKLDARIWERNRAMEYCDKFRGLEEEMQEEERRRVPSSVHNDMVIGLERAIAKSRR